jgi:hypothetical protein
VPTGRNPEQLVDPEQTLATGVEWPDLSTDCRNRRNLALAFPLPLALSSLVASECSSPAVLVFDDPVASC